VGRADAATERRQGSGSSGARAPRPMHGDVAMHDGDGRVGGPAGRSSWTAAPNAHSDLETRPTTACRESNGRARLGPLEELAALGVFEIALGGGKELARDPRRLLALADHIRALGMVPNLTTSGVGLTPPLARALRVMGQVNVSVDADDIRGWDGTAGALRAVGRLVEAGVTVGVNTVLTRQGLPHMGALGDRLAARGVSEWQWLRLKPAGRAVDLYAERRLTGVQALELWPLALDLEARTGLTLRFDCALVPFLAAHRPPLQQLETLGIAGCPGGASLWSLGADGAPAPCSFAGATSAAGTLAEAWQADPTLVAWRRRAADPPEPCGSCAYRDVCRGGCRVVSAHTGGDPLAPDPECPQVVAWSA